MTVFVRPFEAFLDCAYYGNFAHKDGSVRHLGDDEFGMGDKHGVVGPYQLHAVDL